MPPRRNGIEGSRLLLAIEPDQLYIANRLDNTAPVVNETAFSAARDVWYAV